ncbi:MAG: outer membrane protein OmpA-like peptidoglycan-associated protein [Granulosicoccus sp.]|jgi:outer membrane protein OmpA-like peptidoglycan-associated protein
MNLKTWTILALSFSIILGCKFTQKITDGKMAFERKQYSVAVDMLNKEYKKADSRVEKGKIAFFLAESYKKINKNSSAITWYKTAYDNQYGVDALREYSFALKKNEQYEDAMASFKELGLEIGSPYEYRKEITACKIALDWQKQGDMTGYEIEPASFNSTSAEYAPTPYLENQIVFTSDRSNAKGDNIYNWTGGKFSDLFIANTSSNTVEAFSSIINTPNNEGTIAFNHDFTEIYFSRCYDSEDVDYFCKLMHSDKEGDSWTEPVVLEFVEPNVNYGHPTLSKDGSSLYFSADHPDGWGGYDIFVAERTPDGWDTPRPLSRTINSDKDEKFPFIHNDTLYFASDGHTGMGGLDVFRSVKTNKDAWSPIINLKAPINSGWDDFGYVVDPNFKPVGDILHEGYFTSSRVDGKGSDDIYRFVKRVPPPPPPKPVVVNPEPIVYKLILNGYVLEKIYQFTDNPNSKILGRKPLLDSKVEINVNGEKRTVAVDVEGKFSLELEEDTDYNFFGSHEGYFNNSTRFSSKGIAQDENNPVQNFEIEIVLDKIFKNREITLDDIYYDFNQWNIRRDAEPTLNELANTLLENPNIRIQMASHTDCRGKTNYNQTLSQRRAQSAVDYLITKGVESERLQAKGFGKSSPAIDCLCSRCSEEEHQANRRTTFSVVD